MTQIIYPFNKKKISKKTKNGKVVKTKVNPKEAVNTKDFWQRQKFGKASEVTHIDPNTLPPDLLEQYLKNK